MIIDIIKFTVKNTNPDKIFHKEKYVKEVPSSKEIPDINFSSKPIVAKLLKKEIWHSIKNNHEEKLMLPKSN